MYVCTCASARMTVRTTHKSQSSNPLLSKFSDPSQVVWHQAPVPTQPGVHSTLTRDTLPPSKVEGETQLPRAVL